MHGLVITKQMKKRIVITGGHHNSALVVAELLRQKGYEVVWFGHKFSMWGDREPGAEYKEVTQAGFRFIEIKAGRLGRPYNFQRMVRFPLGFFQAFFNLLKNRPNLILSFGGYLAVPVVISGWLQRIPVVTHEQTVVYGLANRLISHFSKKIFISWETSAKHFPAKKVVFTGLPLRPEIFASQKKKAIFKNNLPIIYITGGKQGTYTINQAVEKILLKLLKKYNVIHQCGSSTIFEAHSRFKSIKNHLVPELKARYLPKDYVFIDEIGQVLAEADLVVGRSGAHIAYEMSALGKPSLFIPIPWSRANEQVKNAQMLVEVGTAEILSQEDLTPETLFKRIEKMMNNLDQYMRNADQAKRLVKLDAAQKIVSEIEKIV